MVLWREYLLGVFVGLLGVICSLEHAQGSSSGSQGGFQHSWCNRTAGNQLAGRKPEKGCWPGSRRPVVDNYSVGRDSDVGQLSVRK